MPKPGGRVWWNVKAVLNSWPAWTVSNRKKGFFSSQA